MKNLIESFKLICVKAWHELISFYEITLIHVDDVIDRVRAIFGIS